jgi:hypothetical protein
MSPLLGRMKLAYKIKPKLVTQAAIIIGVVAFVSGSLASNDPPAPPFPTSVPPPLTAFHPIGPLILRVSPPPGSSNPKEFHYNLSTDVTQGSFAAAQAFFVANGHKVETLEFPDLDAIVAASPGAIICWLSKLPVLVFSKGGQLLLAQVIAGLTSTVGGFALGGGTPPVTPRSFLHCYLEVPPPSWSNSLFTMVLLSHRTSVLPVQGGAEGHGGPPSCPDPVGINIASSARPAASPHFGGHGLYYGPRLQYVCSSPASRVGNVPYEYGGFFRTAPPHNFGYYHHGQGGTPVHHGGHPSAQLSPLVHGGRLFVYGGGTFPQGHVRYPRAATSVALSLAFAGLSVGSHQTL